MKLLVIPLCPTLWDSMTVAHHAPLSMGFSRQEYWSYSTSYTGCHALLQGIFPTQGLNLVSCIVGRFFTIWATRKLESFSFCDALFLSHLSQGCMASCFVFFPWLNRRTIGHLYSEEKINVSPLKGGYRALFHISPTWFHHQLQSFLLKVFLKGIWTFSCWNI